MKKIICLLFCLILVQVAQAQRGTLKRADRYYSVIAYALAAESYEKLLDTKLETPQMLSRLANCYYQNGDSEKAEEMYSKMINTPEANTEDFYQFAQTLRENQKYDEYKKLMEKYADMDRVSFMSREFKAKINYLTQLEEEEARFVVKNLAVNSQWSDFGGYANETNKSIFFVSNRTPDGLIKRSWSWNDQPFLDLYEGELSDSMEIQKAKVYNNKVNTVFHEGPMCYTPDMSKVFFTRNNIGRRGEGKQDENGIQNLKIYYADLDENGTWINIREFPYNNLEYSVGHPTVSKDGKKLYFASDMPGGVGGSDIYEVSIENGAKDIVFGTPFNLGNVVNTEGQEMFPWIDTLDNLYLSSDGHFGFGGLDNFIAINTDGAITEVLNLGKPINSNNDDFGFIMNLDATTGFFSSNRKGGKGNDDIYSFLMLRPLKKQLTLKGLITDQKTQVPLVGAIIGLYDEKGNLLASAISDKEGKYKFPLEKDFKYKLKGEQDDYFPRSGSFNTVSLDQKTIELNLSLEKYFGLGLYALVTDKMTGAPIENVNIKVIDLKTRAKVMNGVTPATGDLMNSLADNKVGDCLKYQIIITKSGYLVKVALFNRCIDKPGIVNLHELLDITLTKIQVSMDLAKVIEIKPIYFDFNKFNIRPDAQLELNKIVQVMNDNPGMEIELGSHTDCRSSYAYNEKLSDKRAKSSAEWVKERITNPSRIIGKGYGESKLLNDCACEGDVKSDCSEEDHQLNRRTEFIIIKM
jgi:outer membrane protein OmpA-like peptidoglycan-associated protein/tetratricopeptide (TPR) repeat protein